MKARILFVCGRNKWRSPTAERIYRNDPRVDVRSAGISDKSTHQISYADVEWADLILVMEDDYKRKLSRLFRDLNLPPVDSLDIPDEYQYMDKELIELIKSGVEHHIKSLAG
jgi:protein-tyrosine phosphatase